MKKDDAAVAVYNSHAEAERAVQDLQRGGYDMKKLSIVAKDYHTDEHVVGYYNAGDRMKYWGKWALFGAVFGVGCSGQHSLPYPASVRSWSPAL